MNNNNSKNVHPEISAEELLSALSFETTTLFGSNNVSNSNNNNIFHLSQQEKKQRERKRKRNFFHIFGQMFSDGESHMEVESSNKKKSRTTPMLSDGELVRSSNKRSASISSSMCDDNDEDDNMTVPTSNFSAPPSTRTSQEINNVEEQTTNNTSSAMNNDIIVSPSEIVTIGNEKDENTKEKDMQEDVQDADILNNNTSMMKESTLENSFDDDKRIMEVEMPTPIQKPQQQQQEQHQTSSAFPFPSKTNNPTFSSPPPPPPLFHQNQSPGVALGKSIGRFVQDIKQEVTKDENIRQFGEGLLNKAKTIDWNSLSENALQVTSKLSDKLVEETKRIDVNDVMNNAKSSFSSFGMFAGRFMEESARKFNSMEQQRQHNKNPFSPQYYQRYSVKNTDPTKFRFESGINDSYFSSSSTATTTNARRSLRTSTAINNKYRQAS